MAACLVFRIERPILGDNPKPHKFACSDRLPSSVTEAWKWLRNNVMSSHQCAQTLPLSTRLIAIPIWDKTKNKDFMKSGAFHMKSGAFQKTTCKEW